jgi:hypothetical protein
MQRTSWFLPFGTAADPDLIGQIFFPFDKSGLDAHDRSVLDQISMHCRQVAERNRIELRLIGHADRRGSDRYNEQLAKRRALEVKAYLDAHIRQTDMYSSWQALSDGERHAAQRRPGALRMAHDRRVDVFRTGVQCRHKRLSEVPLVKRISRLSLLRASHDKLGLPAPSPETGGSETVVKAMIDAALEMLERELWSQRDIDLKKNMEKAIYGDEVARDLITVPADYGVNAVEIRYEETLSGDIGLSEISITDVTYSWGPPAERVKVTKTHILKQGHSVLLNKTFPLTFMDRAEADSSPLIFPPNP